MAGGGVLEIAGEVVSGLGRGAYFVQLEWVRSRLGELMGAPPFAGTLNLRVQPRLRDQLFAARRRFLPILPPGEGSCPGYVLEVQLRAPAGPQAAAGRLADAWAVLPEATAHADIIEVVSPYYLREHLRLADGDRLDLLAPI